MYNRGRFSRESRRPHSFQKGDLKYVILGLIKDKPRHGYDIIRSLEESSHGFYKPSAGAVYPILQMLEDMGHASADEQDGKKVYTITEDGRKFLNEQGDFTRGVKNMMKNRWNSQDIDEINELLHEVDKLGRLIRRQYRQSDANKTRRIREIIYTAFDGIEGIIRE